MWVMVQPGSAQNIRLESERIPHKDAVSWIRHVMPDIKIVSHLSVPKVIYCRESLRHAISMQIATLKHPRVCPETESVHHRGF